MMSSLNALKAAVAGLLLFVAAAGLTSCGGTSTSHPPPPPPTTPDAKADALLAQMTQAEKLQLVQGGVTVPDGNYNYTVPRGAGGWVPGNTRLNIPALYLADGSVGAGNAIGQATALPSSMASAATWDLNEATKYGNVIGTELAAYGINVNLGGNINLTGRDPRDGRTFETKGEDPILAGKITAAHISAIQAQHIIGGIKHFSFNDQESGRTTANVVIDERSGRESDLLAFEIGVKDSNVQSVMCSYNLTNGVYDCENNHLLNDVLKNDWQFPGFVMSDWWATHSTAIAANNGLDQEQPNQQYFSSLGTAVSGGQVAQSRLDNMVHRILRAMYAVGIFDNPQNIQPIPAVADAAVAQEVEEQGAVLLKNASNQLPLSTSVQSIAIIGSHADTAVLSGGGSAQVQPVGGALHTQPNNPCPPCWSQVVWDPSSPLQAIQAKAPGAKVQYADGSNAGAAAALASSSQVAIVFVNQWASEGMDEPSLALNDLVNPAPINQDALVAAVVAANPHTIVVVESGGPILMPWLSQVSAVLEAWYPGQNGGPAIADLLFGVANPSGKLPITFPAGDSQLPRPVTPQPPDGTTPFNVNYSEGYNVGYKWFDANGLTPLFPFGFGLSYTSFSITNPAAVNNLSSTSKPNFQITFTLANTGTVAGAEVAQVYLGMPANLNEPPKRLVGWQKVKLDPGASQSVTIEVDQNDSSHPMSYWDTNSNAWKVASGAYTVYLGNSSAMSSLVVAGTINVQ
ncbi:MAG TPA: glycoside hydrolase family 3 C-terminal domain-containing protein [Terracidiphilus sp.]|nr:glycoside hydrolase family 3 C-terminal domain-containing protein [Terracidiphilus sp.]